MRELTLRDLVLVGWYLRLYRLRTPLAGGVRPRLFALRVAGTVCAAYLLGVYLYWRAVFLRNSIRKSAARSA
jgi:hypothetical protein